MELRDPANCWLHPPPNLLTCWLGLASMSVFRSFGAIHGSDAAIVMSSGTEQGNVNTSVEGKVARLREDIIGQRTTLSGPYGEAPCVYTDWTASGRALKSIEGYLAAEVMPWYGNTHTTSNITGHQSTCFRHEARQIVAEATNAKITGRAAVDTVIFTGNGTTAAIKKVVESLGLTAPIPAGFEHESYRPVVFTSAYEHHSNLLPWRESVADVVTVAYHPVTGVCLTDLRDKLLHYSGRKLKVGTFAAASNVTGILTAVDQVAAILHRAGAYAIFDYATAAPYVKMDMNPLAIGPDAELTYKDAIIFSGHKFLGGPGAPGVLIAKRRLLSPQQSIPTTVGGGTVFYVTKEHHRYLSNWEEREEGGTPHILGDIKLGLAMHVKQSIGSRWIELKEEKIATDVHARMRSIPNLVVLGRTPAGPDGGVAKHLPIFPFVVRAGKRFLHHNFVCVLLNDLFGIQSRGGCQCAGPFSQLLLGLDADANHRFEMALLDKHEVLRPGYSRLSIPFWFADAEVDHVISALAFVAEHGWKFLRSYRYQPKTGEWAHSTRMTKFPERKWLSHFAVGGAEEVVAAAAAVGATSSAAIYLAEAMAGAQKHLKDVEKTKGRAVPAGAQGTQLDVFEGLRWFAIAGDADLGAAWSADDRLGPVKVCADGSFLATTNATAASVVSAAPPKETGSAYAQHRAETKMREEVGGHASRLPRYIVLVGGEATEEAATGASTSTTTTASSTTTATTTAATTAPGPSPGQPASVAGLASTTSTTAKTKATNASKAPAPEAPTFTLVSTPQPTGRHHFPHKTGADGKVTRSMPIAKASKRIMKQVGLAIQDWDMIKEGDRLLLGLSGGKDSMALLHVLLQKQRAAPVNFEIACATIDPQTDSFDPSPLIGYCEAMGVTYHYLSEPIVELAKTKMQGDSLCAFCSRFKRGLLYNCCRDFNYNKLVLAQHLDDLAESFIMSAFHGGQVRTMKAHYKIEAGDVHVIRPLVYVRETDTRDFASDARLPIINENCPACFEEPKERHRVKKLLQQEEASVPGLFGKLKHALIPLMDDDLYVATKAVMDRIADNNSSNRRIKRKATHGGAAPPPAKKAAEGNDTAASSSSSSMDIDLCKKYSCNDGLCFEIA